MNNHFIAYGILALIILFLLNNVLTKKSPGAAPAPGGAWTVYGTMGCGWTRKQLELMDGKGVPYKFVDCDSENCPGVNGFPTLIDPKGNKTTGFNNLE
jgi:hypothetical protein